MLRRAFSLIELLVVIAVITVLAGIILPVLAQAREKARQTQCISNIRQIGQALLTYSQDYDERFPPSRQDAGGSSPCAGEFVRGSQWNKVVLPYVRSERIFTCPSDPTRGQSPYPPRSYAVVAGPPALKSGCSYVNGVMGPGWGASYAEVPEPASTALAYERIEGFTIEDEYGVHANLAEDWCNAGTRHVAYLRKSRWFSYYKPLFEGPHAGGGTFVFCDVHARWLKYDQSKTGGDKDCLTPAAASFFDRRYPM